MIAALRGDETVYLLLVTLHIVAVVVGFGSTFVYPMFGRRAAKIRGREAAAMSDATLSAAKILTTPMIYAAAIIGLILVAVGPYDWDARFVQASIVLVIVATLFSAFVHVPNLRAMNRLTHELAEMGAPPSGASGPPPQATEMETRGKAAARNGGFLDLMFLALVLLMVFKPL